MGDVNSEVGFAYLVSGVNGNSKFFTEICCEPKTT